MEPKTRESPLDDFSGLEKSFVQLARIALAGQDREAPTFIQRVARRYRSKAPDFSNSLIEILRQAPSAGSPLRRAATPLPVDSDNRLTLAEVEWPKLTDSEPILEEKSKARLTQLIEERRRRSDLLKFHLYPTRTTLLIGPPGVGKTLAARWIAASLELPLLVLDLSTVMSSFLGRTGINVRHVMDYAKQQDCVLLLDEIDAIGKRRDDPTDIGELKRLVNVLLQQIDQWPPEGGLLIAATNHPDLLDPAIWRRFETVIEFALPNDSARQIAIRQFTDKAVRESVIKSLSLLLEGASFGDIESMISRAKRASALSDVDLEQCLLLELRDLIAIQSSPTRRKIATELYRSGTLTQRQTSEITGVSRDTIRKGAATREI